MAGIKINPRLDPYGEKRECDECICDWCYQGIASHGMKMFVGEKIENSDYDEWHDWKYDFEKGDASEDDEPMLICESCGDDNWNELMEVIYR